MSPQADLTPDGVAGAVAEYLATTDRDNSTPTVREFAERIGVKRPTLYARFPDAIAAIAAHKQASVNRSDRRQQLIARLRGDLTAAHRSEANLREQNRVFANRIRELTLENEKLRDALKSQRGVANLPRRTES